MVRRANPLPQRWYENAACRDDGADVEDFFALDDRSGRPEKEPIARALAYCSRCPVRVECLVHALATPETYGVWGGTTSAERKHIRRDLRNPEITLETAVQRMYARRSPRMRTPTGQWLRFSDTSGSNPALVSE